MAFGKDIDEELRNVNFEEPSKADKEEEAHVDIFSESNQFS